MVLLHSNINLAGRLMIRAFLPVPRQDQRFGGYLHTAPVLRTKISSADLYICIQVGLKGDEEYIFRRGVWMANPSTSPAFVGYGMKTQWDGNARLQSSCFENITVKEQPNVKKAQVKEITPDVIFQSLVELRWKQYY